MKELEPTITERRRLTRNSIYQLIFRSKEPVSKQEIANSLGYSLPTVHQNISELMDAGLICVGTVKQSTGGRPPVGYEICPDVKFSVGASITANHLRFLACNLKQEEIAYRSINVTNFDVETVGGAQIKDELPAPLNLLYPMTKAARKVPKLPAAGDFIRWNDFLRGGKTIDELPDHPIGYTEGASILYSGGTTGTTKGILLSSANFNATALQTIAASGLHDIHGKKMLSVMPIFHGFGLGIGIHTALVGGATCILVPQFNVKTYAKLLIKKKPNLVPGVPTLFEALLRTDLLEDADLSFLDGMFSGGDSLSVELKHKVDDFLKAHRAKIQIREGYGTTECVTASCLTPKDYARSGSIGVPFPDTYYKIVKPGTTEETDPNIEGEICISGPSVMMCYVDNPEETAQTLRRHADGRIWLHTGDLGAMDTDGFVYFRQRIKRMIITSGYNVYPSQLENIIDGHEKVLLSCVVGVKDKYKMQKVKAFVVLRPGFEPTEEVRQELFDHCRKHIAKYAMPYEIEFRTELPKTLVGKVAYRVLEEEANAQVEA